MTFVPQRTTNARAGTTAEPAPDKHRGTTYLRKLTAVERVATDILSRIEKILREDPSAIVDSKTQMLPREIEDKQAYFLGKIERAQKTLKGLADLVVTGPADIALHEQIGVELMVFSVLIEYFRPQRIRASGWNPGGAEDAIREKIESLVLDIINMRERLK